MFDVTKELAKWRREQLRGGMNRRIVEELDGHLVESFHDWKRNGEKDAEAWHLALKSLGNSTELRQEFSKLSPPILLGDKLALGFFLALFLLSALGSLLPMIDALLNPGHYAGWHPDAFLLTLHVTPIVLGFLSTIVCGLAASYALYRRLFTRCAEARLFTLLRRTVNLALVIAVIALGTAIGGGMLWSNQAWGSAWRWDSRETISLAVFLGLLALVVLSLLRRLRTETLLLATATGGALLCAGWTFIIHVVGGFPDRVTIFGFGLAILQILAVAVGCRRSPADLALTTN